MPGRGAECGGKGWGNHVASEIPDILVLTESEGPAGAAVKDERPVKTLAQPLLHLVASFQNQSQP